MPLTFDLSLRLIGRDGDLSTLSHSCRFGSQMMVPNRFPGTGCLRFLCRSVWVCHLLVNLYIWTTISFCYGWIRLTLDFSLGLIGRDGGLGTLCHNYRFACQQRVLKTFPGPGYLHCKDGVVWQCHLLVNLYISCTTSSCCDSILLNLDLSLRLIRRNGVLCTLCDSRRFTCAQKVLNVSFLWLSLHSEDGVFWICHLLVNLYIWLTVSSSYGWIPLTLVCSLGLIKRNGGLNTPCHSCVFCLPQRVLKMFPSPRYLHYEDEVVWLCQLLADLYIWLTVWSSYSLIPFTLDLSFRLIWRDSGLRTLRHSCGFTCD